MSKFVKGDDSVDDSQWLQKNTKTEPEKVDNRSLYEKLQEQRAIKEEAFQEANKFSTLIRRLDDDEVDFLASVNEQREKEERNRRLAKETAIAEFRRAQAALERESPPPPAIPKVPRQEQQTAKRKQVQITGIVKKGKVKTALIEYDSEEED